MVTTITVPISTIQSPSLIVVPEKFQLFGMWRTRDQQRRQRIFVIDIAGTVRGQTMLTLIQPLHIPVGKP
jgi:hypothetical protein